MFKKQSIGAAALLAIATFALAAAPASAAHSKGLLSESLAAAATSGGVFGGALTMASPGPAAPASSGAFGWGFNQFGQLGDGTTTPEQNLVPVQACAAGPQAACPSGPFLSEVATVSAGASFSVALLSNATVMAWGENGSDQLGNGTTEAKSDVPVAVPGLSEVTAIAAGHNHTLALLRNGTVVAWGENSSGQLGNGTTTNSRTPVAVSGLSGVKAIAAGGFYGLALLSDGTVMAWGSNFSGELGIGTTTKTDVPVKVCAAGPQAACPTGPFLSEVTAISAAEGVGMALLKNGTVTDWGGNPEGGLGNGTTTASDVPVAVSGLSGVVGLPNSGAHMALLSNGTVMDWGSNGSGELGDGTSTGPELCGTGEACSRVPVMVTGLSGVTAIADGGDFRLAVSNGGGKAWGANFAGQLGNGTTTQSDVPVSVSGLSGITAVAASGLFGLAAAASLAPLPTVTQVEPNLGSPGGGTTVKIAGTNFTGATAVKFGSTNAASFTVNSATSITAVSPAGTGLVNVTVTTAAGTSATGPNYDYRPFVSTLAPRDGANAGGTSVEIIGTNFNEVEAVKFGSTSVSFTRNSETSITAVSPPWAGGSARVIVSVTTKGGVSPERAATILGPEYFGYAPTVTRVSPTSGPAAGGTHVTIEGTAFESIRKSDEFPPFVASVKFGSTNATSFTVNSEGSVTAVAPAGTGTVDVTVETYAGTSLTSSADHFTFTPPNPPTFATSFTPEESVGGFNQPDAVALDPSGNIWVADSGHDRVLEFNKERKFLRQFGVEGAGAGQYEGIAGKGIAGVATNSSGDVYLTGSDRVEEFSPTGEFLRQWGSPGSGNGQFLYPNGIAVDSSGNVWVLDTFNYRVQEFSASGAYLGQFGSKGTENGQLGWASGLAFSGGNLYVADSARVQEFSTAGTYLAQFGSSGTGNGQFHGLGGIASDPATGDLYVSDTYNNRVQVFSPAGAFITAFGSGGPGNGQFSGPKGVAVNSSGTDYVADTGNNRVQEWVGGP